MQLKNSALLGYNAASVGNRILKCRGNAVSSSRTFRPVKIKALRCLETLGSVYPGISPYLRWTDASDTPLRKRQNSHNDSCSSSERMKVLHICVDFHIPSRKVLALYAAMGKDPTTKTHTDSVERSHCGETKSRPPGESRPPKAGHRVHKSTYWSPSLASWSQ
jgi:hypothetical protein